MTKNHEMNLTEGPLFKKMILFALPLIATNLLQYLFNVVDIAVLAAFVGDNAVAAVGATGPIVHLLVNLFIGVSVGANIVIARCVGENNLDGSRKTVGTAVLASLIFGVASMFIGFFGAETFLKWMDCDPEVIGMAAKYLKIYFLGMPIMMLYNFSAAILRAVGDTFRPFLYLIIGGVANVGLNILLVTVFHQDVAGVAIATVASQGIAATLAMISLFKGDGFGKFELKRFRVYKDEMKKMLRIGVPAGLQGMMFPLANLFIQSAVNSFGATVMAGNTIAMQVDAVIFQVTSAIGHTTAAFVGQNYGAKNMERIKKSVKNAACLSFGICVGFGIIIIFMRDLLFGIFTDDPNVIHYANQKLVTTASFQMFYGLLDVFANAIRGLGKSLTAMFVNLFGICVFRLLYLATVFKLSRTYLTLCWAFPASFVVAFIAILCCYFPAIKKAELTLRKDEETLAQTE